jgi:hypothetical protein
VQKQLTQKYKILVDEWKVITRDHLDLILAMETRVFTAQGFVSALSSALEGLKKVGWKKVNPSNQCPKFRDGDISLTLIWHSLIIPSRCTSVSRSLLREGNIQIRVYMEHSNYMTIMLAGHIEAIPYREAILQPVPLYMKDLDAHDREDNP